MFVPCVHAVESAYGYYSIMKGGKFRYVVMYLQGKFLFYSNLFALLRNAGMKLNRLNR